jgi:hypothetical protein
MKEPQLNPQVTDVAPNGPVLTAYDEEHMMTYMRVLDAEQQGADWRDVSRIVLRIDPETEADPRADSVRKPPLARQMDDRARLSPAVAKRCLIIATPLHVVRALSFRRAIH